MSWVQVFPLLTVVAATGGFLLGLALLAKEHHGSPCLQKACTGLVLIALMFSADAAWDAAIARERFDWRLMLFVIGISGAWAYRLAGKTGTAAEAREKWKRRLRGPC
jgi:hypothetical protein